MVLSIYLPIFEFLNKKNVMEATRYSMREFKPLTLEDKQHDLEVQRERIDEERGKLVDKKKEIELELSELNGAARSGKLSSEEYIKVCDRQTVIKQEKYKLEKDILEIKRNMRGLNLEIDSVRLKARKIPNSEVKQLLLELRDKYMSFSADTTRVSSMRAMSSRFVEEINAIAKHLD